MSREQIRAAKRAIARRDADSSSLADLQSSREAALWLLDRSIAFGHAKLALRRLAVAVEIGAIIGVDRWRYCRDIAQADMVLKEIFDRSVAMLLGNDERMPA